MRNVTKAVLLAACVVFGSFVQGQVPNDVPNDRYDIGINSEKVERCPKDKADTLIVYSATWCGPCQMMKPQWTLLRAQGYKVVYIDVDDPHKYDGKYPYQTADLVSFVDSYEVKSVPTVRFYNSDHEAWLAVKGKPFQIVGLTSTSKVKKYLWKPSSSTD